MNQTKASAEAEFGILFKEAKKLAGGGKFREAQEIIDTISARIPGEEVLLLDLKARIQAQQGYFLEAERLWERAKSIAPEDETIKKALEDLRGRKHFSSYVPLFAGGICGIALCLVLLVVLAGIWSVTFSAIPELRSQVRELSASVSEMHGVIRKSGVKTEESFGALERRIDDFAVSADIRNEVFRKNALEAGEKLDDLSRCVGRLAVSFDFANGINVTERVEDLGRHASILSVSTDVIADTLRTGNVEMEKRLDALKHQIEALSVSADIMNDMLRKNDTRGTGSGLSRMGF